MTKEETKKAIEVMQAYVDGKLIELKTKSQDDRWWREVTDPIWDFCGFNYRIKPEPHYRSFKNAEEVMEAIKEHGGYVKEGNTYRYLKKFTTHEDGSITYILSGWSATTARDWESIHDKITWADGTLFGKLEE